MLNSHPAVSYLIYTIFLIAREALKEEVYMTNTGYIDAKTFNSPFEKGYWYSAFAELKKPKMMIIAAIITAIRIVLKAVSIPVLGNYVQITFAFYANALGSLVYGPIWGLLGGIVSDTVGAILFPSGQYFLPFVITECLGSFIYALFLYKCKLSILRVYLAKFSVMVICNLTLTPIIMNWYYQYFGIEKVYKYFTVVRLMKNIALFPIEATILCIFLGIIVKITDKLNFTSSYSDKMKITTKHILMIIGLTIVSIGIFVLTYLWYIKNK